MKENVRFYKCPICGNIVGLIDGNMEHITCCGKPMEEMVANTTDAAVEKHVPVYERVEDEIFVKVNHVMEKDVIRNRTPGFRILGMSVHTLRAIRSKVR